MRPILEYGSAMRDPFNSNGSIQLERVQRNILRYVSFILDVQYPSRGYVSISKALDLESLADRRRLLDKASKRSVT